MKLIVASAVISAVLFLSFKLHHVTDDVPTLAIGASAPDFKLPGVDGKKRIHCHHSASLKY